MCPCVALCTPGYPCVPLCTPVYPCVPLCAKVPGLSWPAINFLLIKIWTRKKTDKNHSIGKTVEKPKLSRNAARKRLPGERMRPRAAPSLYKTIPSKSCWKHNTRVCIPSSHSDRGRGSLCLLTHSVLVHKSTPYVIQTHYALIKAHRRFFLFNRITCSLRVLYNVVRHSA